MKKLIRGWCKLFPSKPWIVRGSVTFASILLLILSIPVFFTFKNGYGDLLFLEDFSRDVLFEGGDLRSWSMTPSASWIPDVVLYCVGALLFTNPFDTMYFVSLCQILLLCIGATLIVRQVTRCGAGYAALLFLHVLMVVTYCSYTTGMWMYFNSTNNHIAPCIMAMFALENALRLTKSLRISTLIAQVALVWCGVLSGPIFIIAYVYPLCCVSCIFGVFVLAVPRLKSVFYNGLVVSGVALLVVRVYAFFFVLPSGHFVPNFDRIVVSFNLLARDTWDLVVSENPHFYALMVVWALGMASAIYLLVASITAKPSLQAKHDVMLYLSTFVLLLVPLEISAAIVSGGVHNHGGYRYFMLPIALPIILFGVVLALLSNSRIPAWSIVAGFILTDFGIAGVFLPSLSQHFIRHRSAYITPSEAEKFRNAFDFPISRKEIIDHHRMADKELVTCLDAWADTLKMDTGIAEFWDARSISLLSKKGLRAYAFTTQLQPLYMMTSIDRFLEPTSGRTPFYNFVVTSERFPPGHPRHLSSEVIRALLGREHSSFVCDNAPEKNLVLVYDEKADSLIKDRITPTVRSFQFMNGTQGIVRLRGRDLPILNGVTVENRVVSNTSAHQLITYGPYVTLPPGDYGFELKVESVEASDLEAIGRWDLFTAFDQRVHQEGKFEIGNGKAVIIQGEFQVTHWQKHLSWEIRTFGAGQGRFAVESLTLVRRN